MSVIVDGVEICDHFVEDYENERILIDNYYVRRLNEELVKQKTVYANLMVGYEQFVQINKFENKMLGILEYLRTKMSESKLNFKQATHNVEFVTRRSTLARAASTPFQRKSEHDPGFTLTACKLNGVVFLCQPQEERSKPTDEEEIAKQQRIKEFRKQNAYVKAKLDQGLTLAKGQTKHTFSGVASTATAWNMLSKFDLIDRFTQSTHQILIASTADAVDKNDEYVQIVPIRANHAPKPVDVLIEEQIFPHVRLRYLLGALFSGQRRVVGGVHLRRWNHLKQIVDMDASVFLDYDGGLDLNECLKYLFDLLSEIRTFLNSLPEGTIIHIERPKFDPEHKIRVVDEIERQKFDFVGDEFRHLVGQPQNQ